MATKKRKRIAQATEEPRDEQAIMPALANFIDACAGTVARINPDDAKVMRAAAKKVRRGTKRAHAIRDGLARAFGPLEEDDDDGR